MCKIQLIVQAIIKQQEFYAEVIRLAREITDDIFKANAASLVLGEKKLVISQKCDNLRILLDRHGFEVTGLENDELICNQFIKTLLSSLRSFG